MGKIIDLAGQKFNRLTVISLSHINNDCYWNCLCECGNNTTVRASRLKSGDTKSCGCLHKDACEAKREKLTGQKFNRLTVISFSHMNHTSYWNCLCDCGNKSIVRGSHLQSGQVKSCGCFGLEQIKKSNTTHGMTNHPIFAVWHCMVMRCTHENVQSYENYGGRGITVCDKWLTFEGFYEDMKKGYEKGLSIDRINNDGDYELSNCKWSTPKEQCNNRRSNRFLTFNGKTQTVSQWADEIGISYGKLNNRMAYNWSTERALTTP